jgi:hypothetical protein
LRIAQPDGSPMGIDQNSDVGTLTWSPDGHDGHVAALISSAIERCAVAFFAVSAPSGVPQLRLEALLTIVVFGGQTTPLPCPIADPAWSADGTWLACEGISPNGASIVYALPLGDLLAAIPPTVTAPQLLSVSAAKVMELGASASPAPPPGYKARGGRSCTL